jgi:DNA-binding NtrC family response regulator
MSADAQVLIVDDEPNVRRVLSVLLRRDGYRTLEAGDGEEALRELDAHPVHAVVADLKMPRMNGLELLDAVQRLHPGVPVVLLTAHGTVGSAVEALKLGALDYLTKPYDPEEVRQVVAKAVKTCALDSQETQTDRDDDPESLLIGPSPSLAEVMRVVERVAPTLATVVITGESGTGKELVARSLHRRSERAGAPFVKVNCAAIPDGLLESELFGYEKGAFTGAGARKPGRFELAHEGTLFLDEIGEMPLSAQPKLLRAIQEGRFFRVGGTRTVSVDVRLVVATNRNLKEEVQKGSFREDLYYRINVVPIRLPALRQRREDIPILAERFLERFAARQQRHFDGFAPEALELLRAHSWPGNIRELENAVERSVLLADGTVIEAEDLPGELQRDLGASAGTAERMPLRERVRRETRRLERDAIREALRATDGNVTRAAKRLGLSRRGLQLKMKELKVSA